MEIEGIICYLSERCALPVAPAVHNSGWVSFNWSTILLSYSDIVRERKNFVVEADMADVALDFISAVLVSC